MKHLLSILALAIFISCSNKNSSLLVIDPSIKNEAKEHFSISKYGNNIQGLMLYENDMGIEYFESNKLLKSIKLKEQNKSTFKSYFTSKQDTLYINGLYGLWGGSGFSIKIINGQPKLFHVANSDNFPSYSTTKNGDYKQFVEIPCKNTKIILSKEPVKNEKDTIFGYVEFNSVNYFVFPGSADGKELGPRKEISINMKTYFQTKWVELK
tara:strand:+ start:60 stop:689 length:630 start_codon:yes stop_codon:yes gene_type:complete